MKRTVLIGAASLLIGLGISSGSVEAGKTKTKAGGDTINVDCNTGVSLQNAIDNASGAVTITFFGSCVGDLLIAKDDITLQGETSTDEIVGEVSLEGARRTRFSNMTITGGANGITAFDGAVLRATDMTVTATSGWGVGSFLGALVVLTNVEIDQNAGRGVEVSLNATVDIRQNSSIHDNAGDGVGVFSGSYARIAGATVQDNGGFGVQVAESRVRIGKRNGVVPSITGNTDTAVFILNGSNARIDDATISSLTEQRALFIHRGSNGVVRRSTLMSSSGETVLVNKGSAAEFSDNTISNSVSGTALQVANGSSVSFRSNESPGNTLTATGGIAVGVAFGSHMQQNGAHDTFDGNIDIFGGSVAEFRDARIKGNIEVSQRSWLRLRNGKTDSTTTVDSNIDISGDSMLSFKIKSGAGLVQVGGAVNCSDGESSVAGNIQAFGVTDRADVEGGLFCTGFDSTP